MRESPASEGRHGSRLVTQQSQSHTQNRSSSSHERTVVGSNETRNEETTAEGFATGEREDTAVACATPVRESRGSDGSALNGQVLHIVNAGEFEPLLDVAEAARLLRIHPKTLRVKAGQGIIPGIQIGRAWRFRASMLNRWLEDMTDRS